MFDEKMETRIFLGGGMDGLERGLERNGVLERCLGACENEKMGPLRRVSRVVKKPGEKISVARHKTSGLLPGCGICVADLEARSPFHFTAAGPHSCAA